MKYHGHPAEGDGGGLLHMGPARRSSHFKAVLYRPYNWANMPDALDGAQPGYQIDEVARLIRDLGIVNHTSFGSSGSGASIRASGLIENFGYAATIHDMTNYDTDTFFNYAAQ